MILKYTKFTKHCFRFRRAQKDKKQPTVSLVYAAGKIRRKTREKNHSSINEPVLLSVKLILIYTKKESICLSSYLADSCHDPLFKLAQRRTFRICVTKSVHAAFTTCLIPLRVDETLGTHGITLAAPKPIANIDTMSHFVKITVWSSWLC